MDKRQSAKFNGKVDQIQSGHIAYVLRHLPNRSCGLSRGSFLPGATMSRWEQTFLIAWLLLFLFGGRQTW